MFVRAKVCSSDPKVCSSDPKVCSSEPLDSLIATGIGSQTPVTPLCRAPFSSDDDEHVRRWTGELDDTRVSCGLNPSNASSNQETYE